jgi:tRNA (mo5U34)-methyltransferase
MTDPPDDPTTWTPEALRAEADSRTWFHTIDLGHGVLTRGQKDTPTEVGIMEIPDDLTGRTVLDVGAYDGFYSFECERRGASRVVAADHWAWTWPSSDARGNFELARAVLASKVEDVVVTVEDLGPETVGGPYDVVLFLGVLYHSPDPIGYLRRIRSVTGGVAIVETVVDMLDVPVPACAYYPGRSLNDDASNHFGPNPAAVEGWALEAGFSRVVPFEPWFTQPVFAVEAGRLPVDRSLLARVRRRLRPGPRSGRMVFHLHP